MRRLTIATGLLFGLSNASNAQTPPTAAELKAYVGPHAAAALGDIDLIHRLPAMGENLNTRDTNGRTPLHVAAFVGHAPTVQELLVAGANPSLLDNQRYDAVTIAAVRDDVPVLRVLLAGGASASLVTSPYDGTALIAAAHLGHDGVVRELIRAGAPLDHVNNLGWTALIEAVILGNGGPRHLATVEALIQAGARADIADRNGVTPLMHARQRGYASVAAVIEAVGRP